MTAGLAGLIGTIMLGPRIGFFEGKDVPKTSFEYIRARQRLEQEKIDQSAKNLQTHRKDLQGLLKVDRAFDKSVRDNQSFSLNLHKTIQPQDQS